MAWTPCPRRLSFRTMKAFAALLENLVFTPGRNAKLAHLMDYFAQTPDPDRGWALAALAGELDIPAVKSARIRGLVAERVDPVLFQLSYDYVGDLAETVALIWPEERGGAVPRLGEVVDALMGAGPVEGARLLGAFADRMGPSERLALIKLATGGLRVGVSARLARTALAEWSGRPLERIEELWYGVEPPYAGLFHWLEGGEEPEADLQLAFRPMMLANPVEERWSELDPAAYAAEWKWDGIRVQAASFGNERRLYSRTGDEIGQAFPDILEAMDWQGVVDGELLVLRDGPEGGEVAPFSDLQQRLNRKRVSARMLFDFPAHLRLYDILHDGAEDTRPLPFAERRARLAAWFEAARPGRTDLSALIPFADWAELTALRDGARAAGQEGLMLKRLDSPYTGGRPTGPWWKWKRDPLTADCVLIYAQRGHGKRSSFYSDFTFAAWRGEELVPVGKAYSGYTDEELVELDRWIRNNTTDRFGPVRAVKPEIILEVAFDAVQRSTRHKSGIAMRFPRIKRIRRDKPIAEADTLANLEALIEGEA